MSAIYRRELRSYFTGTIGVIFIGFILFMTAVASVQNNLVALNTNFEYALYTISIVYLLIVPILTMRSFAEERSSKTDQLLYSLPIKVSSVVLGKYFAMLTVLLAPTALMALYPVAFSRFGNVNFASAYSSLLAFFLLGCALISIGMFISSMTDSQSIAAVLTVVAMLFLYLMYVLVDQIPTTSFASLVLFVLLAVIVGLIVYYATKHSLISLSTGGIIAIGIIVYYFIDKTAFSSAFPNMLKGLYLFDQLTAFITGMFDLKAILYYLSVIVLFVFFTVQSMEKKRWS